MKSPNFVVGHLRSGTAFMASMLNACPEANAEWEALFRLTCVENDPTGLPNQSGSALRGGPATFHAITQRRLCHPRVKRPDWEALSRFEKTCAYWTEAQRLCIASLATKKGQYLRVRLEDLASVEHARECGYP